jgi:hypothetical protein
VAVPARSNLPLCALFSPRIDPARLVFAIARAIPPDHNSLVRPAPPRQRLFRPLHDLPAECVNSGKTARQISATARPMAVLIRVSDGSTVSGNTSAI